MKPLAYLFIGLISFWLQLTLAQWISWGGFKPNFPLLTSLLLSFSGVSPWNLLYAATMGLAQDALSHGMLGVYGLSFTLTSLAVRMLAANLFSYQVYTLMLTIWIFAMLENLLSWILLQFSPYRPALTSWLLTGMQVAVYTALLAVLINKLLRGLLRRLQLY